MIVDAADMTEAYVHKAVLKWIHTVAPEVMVWHTPNGGSRHMFEAFELKKMGVVRGVPDIALLPRVCAAGTGVIHFLEIKRPKGGVVSGEQKAFLREAEERGARGAIVKGIDDARAAFAAWGIPTKEALA